MDIANMFADGEDTKERAHPKMTCNDPRFYQILGENFRFCFA
jgi:hypothetical protein